MTHAVVEEVDVILEGGDAHDATDVIREMVREWLRRAVCRHHVDDDDVITVSVVIAMMWRVMWHWVVRFCSVASRNGCGNNMDAAGWTHTRPLCNMALMV